MGVKKGTPRSPLAGRKKGTPNKVTADIKALAQEYGASAITALVSIMSGSENDTARISAAKELLDRGYGKSVQRSELANTDDEPFEVTLIKRVIINQ